MIDSKDILTLFCIPSDEVSDVSIISDTKDMTCVDIELKDIRPCCPFCFSKDIGIKDYYKKRVKNNIMKEQKMIVNVRMRRYVCKKCNKSFKQQFFLTNDKESISYRTKELIRTSLLDRVSMEYIAKKMGVSKQTVINILDEMPNPTRLKLPNVVCIDEFHFSNANTKAGKFPSVLSNPFTAEIIDIIESRHKAYLFEYFKEIPLDERQNTKYFISDMNETYRSVHKVFFTDAVYIVDHFHIIKAYTEAIQTIRKRIMNSYDKNTKEYKYLKTHWKLFLMNRYNLKDSTYINKRTGVVYNTLDTIDMVLKAYPELFEIYWAKDEFCKDMLNLREESDVKKSMDFYINNYSKSTLKELVTIGKMFTNWYQEIVNAYSKNTYGVVLTNAMAESNNNYIQTLINIAYGYTNFTRLRKRVLYVSSNRKKVAG